MQSATTLDATEKVIGTLNGKVMYSKSFLWNENFTGIVNLVNQSFLGASKIMFDMSNSYLIMGGVTFPVSFMQSPVYSGSWQNYSACVYVAGGQVRLAIGEGQTVSEVFLTLKYTK